MFKVLPADKFRGNIGFVALCLMTIGSGMLWGWGAAMFSLGLFAAIDASVDEIVERITMTKRDRRAGP